MEYGQEDDERSEPQRVFHRNRTKLAEREKALRIATAEVDTLQALLETNR